jgi:hypothetical protein
MSLIYSLMVLFDTRSIETSAYPCGGACDTPVVIVGD